MLPETLPQQITTTFTFLGHVPSKKNSLRRIARGSRVFTVPSVAHEEWERQELATLVDAPNLYPPYSIEILFYPGNLRLFDTSNQEESLNDLLVKAGVLEDDCWAAVQNVSRRVVAIDIENPRVEYIVHSSATPATIAQIKTEFEVEAKLQRKMKRLQERVAKIAVV